ncbi:SIS domain-containing protein [Kiloniella sp. EL199]|uniref:SIS domain-containing protein n=1 Tax=Kiloniella sp. EL199 TaxID=2107581 RepID=UPI000EA1DD28|nr:SIS domain-containing protein [Kiloniella sp. EL199]
MAKLRDEYRDKLVELFDKVLFTQTGAFEAARNAISGALKKGKLIYVGGSGHSHMLAEELFYRAGGIAAIQPIFEPDLMLHENARRSSQIEREQGRAEKALSRFKVNAEDVLIVVSNSGRNAYPIELALAGQSKGMLIIALTSQDHTDKVDSRHASGFLLRDVADIVLDNGSVYGDAALKIPNRKVRMGPTSTILGCFLLNALMAEVVEQLAIQGDDVDVFRSSNVEDVSISAEEIASRWSHRIVGL